MSQIQSIVNILQDLGCGLSVNTLITKHNITFDELCNLASQNTQLKQQLIKWYPLYDFEVKTVKQTETNEPFENKQEKIETIEVKEIEGENNEVPARKQIRKRTNRTQQADS